MELVGDATMVAVHTGGALVAVKASKESRINIGVPVHIAVPSSACHVLDTETGARLT